MQLEKTPDFDEWLENLSMKLNALVEARLFRIEEYGHFGDAKSLGDSLAELRWANGLRVYFTVRERQGTQVLLLIGGIKNAQKKDIKKARLLLEKYRANPT